MTLAPATRVARSEAVLFTELEGEMVMMHVETGDYHELNDVGARIWTLLEAPKEVGELCDALAAEYDVSAEACAADVAAFIDRAARLKLVELG